MNQKQYIRQLNRELYLYVSWEERQDILADYREYFRDGSTQGNSEEEIASRLGSPRAAARELLCERKIFTISKQFIRKVISFALSMLLFVFTILIFCSVVTNQRIFDYPFDELCPYLMFLFAILNFFLRARPWNRKPVRKNHLSWIVVGSVSAFVFLGVVLSITTFFIPALLGVFPDFDQSTLGPRMSSLFLIFGCVAFLIWLWLLVDPRNHTPMLQTLNLWFAGLTGFLMTGSNILKGLDEEAYLYTVQIWVDWLWPLAVGCVLTGVATLAVWLVQKRTSQHSKEV